MSKKDPLWSVLKVLPTDYAGYGGEVSEEQKYAELCFEITPAAEAVFNELVKGWADSWIEPMPWQASGKPERVLP